MANKRDLKKDIDFLTYEIIDECCTHLYLYPDKDSEKINGIMDNTLKLREDLIHRANNYDNKQKSQEIKNHFKKIYEDLVGNFNNTIDTLEKLR